VSATADAIARPALRASRLDGFELAALAALFALSLAALGGLLVRVWLKGGWISGSDGYLVVDQFQYIDWIRQASAHLAAGNLDDLHPRPRAFVHPGVIAGGLLHAAGLPVIAAYHVFKVPAVAVVFAGALTYVRRFFDRRADRRLALLLALFSVSPIAALVGWSHLGGQSTKLYFDFIGGEMWTGTWLWGYLFSAIAVGLMPLALLAYERGRDGGPRRALALAGLAGLVCAWLQPWQGATVIAILVAAETWCVARRGRSARAAAGDVAVPVLLTALPLAYYLALSRLDASWALAGRANDLPRWPWWVTVVGLAPLALPAAFAYRLPVHDFADAALRAWPIVAVAIFYLPVGTFPFHAFQGITLPLVVLSVLAVRAHLGPRPLPIALALLIAVVMILPGTLYRADQLRSAVSKGYQPFFLKRGEHDALAYLDRLPGRGGVLAPVYSGLLVPAYTGRETWIGAGSWTPDFAERQRATERLFGGRMTATQAAAVIRSSGARFLFSDCHGRADISGLVAAVARPLRRFGCATVYEVLGHPGGSA
jgi:hypothetical protein